MTEPNSLRFVHKNISFNNKLPLVDPSCFVAPNCFLIGEVILKADSSIWFGTILRGDTDLCEIGKGSSVLELSFVENAIIGDQSMLSHSVIAHHCEIGNDVLVGIGAKILNNAKIGDKSIVGAGALILPNTQIPSKSVVIAEGKVIRNSSKSDIDYIKGSVKEVQEKADILKKNILKTR